MNDKEEEMRMVWWILLGVVGAGILILAIMSVPDLLRYMRIRRM